MAQNAPRDYLGSESGLSRDYGLKTSDSQDTLEYYNYLKANDPKQAVKFLKEMGKLGWNPTQAAEDMAASEAYANQEPEAVTYDDFYDSMKDPLMAEIERHSPDGRGHALGNMVDAMKRAPEEFAAYERKWREAGNEGRSPQMQAFMDDRARSEQVRVDMGIDPSYDYDSQTTDVRGRIADNDAGYQDQVGDINAQLAERAARMEGDYQEHGVGGARYGAQDDQALANMGRVGGEGFAEEYGDNTQGFLGDLQEGVQDGSERNDAVQNMLTSAAQGDLNDPANDFYQKQLALRRPAMDEALDAVTERAGQTRGVGGGRYNKQMLDTARKMQADTEASLSGMQLAQANNAVNYQTGQDNRNVSLAGQAAGMQNAVTNAGLNANQGVAGVVGNRAAASNANENMFNQMAKEGLENQMGVDQSGTDNMFKQMTYDDREKDRINETHVNPIEAAMQETMAYQDLLNMDLGKETKMSKKQRKAANKLGQFQGMGMDGTKVGVHGAAGRGETLSKKQQKKYDKQMKKLGVFDKVGADVTKNKTLMNQMRETGVMPGQASGGYAQEGSSYQGKYLQKVAKRDAKNAKKAAKAARKLG